MIQTVIAVGGIGSSAILLRVGFPRFHSKIFKSSGLLMRDIPIPIPISLTSLGGENIYANRFIDFSMFQNFKELISLNFSQDGYQSIPQSLKNTEVLGNLSNLEVLALKGNGLEGPLPLQEICKLKKMRVLDFSVNYFNGSLHKCLANLTSLQALDLSSNFLSGEIPASALASLTSRVLFYRV
ncbi:hypothetical protein K1719_033488 [Acacia pycnantha]|nr:hypothetical protein K1719_033488 [Acacia pycnantha]